MIRAPSFSLWNAIIMDFNEDLFLVHMRGHVAVCSCTTFYLLPTIKSKCFHFPFLLPTLSAISTVVLFCSHISDIFPKSSSKRKSALLLLSLRREMWAFTTSLDPCLCLAVLHYRPQIQTMHLFMKRVWGEDLIHHLLPELFKLEMPKMENQEDLPQAQ